MTGAKRLLYPLLALLAGIAFIVFGVINFSQHNNYIETDAVVSKVTIIETFYDEPDDVEILVRYTVDGKEYESQLNNTSTNLKEGQNIKVKYDPSDPSKVISASKSYAFIAIGFGALVVLISIFLLLKALRS
jgi:hypothetical protein